MSTVIKKEFGFVIIGTVDNMESKDEAKQFIDKWMRGDKFRNINTIHIFEWRLE